MYSIEFWAVDRKIELKISVLKMTILRLDEWSV